MRRTLLSWAFLFVSTSLAACSPPPPTACNPSCREGFTCVSGMCVSSCNPACSASERCDTSGGRTRCVASDGGTSSDGAAANDGMSLADTSVSSDGSTELDTGVSMDSAATDTGTTAQDSGSSMDSSSAMDTGVRDAGSSTDASSGTDSASNPDSPDARPACGMPGQSCCGRYCAYGSTCEIPTGSMTGTCVAFTPAMNECVGTAPCLMAGQACGVGYQCGDRRCNLCVANSGTGALGTTCAMSNQCASGFCFQGKCASLCVPGAAGDAACAGMLAGGICGGGTSQVSVTPDAGAMRTSVLSFGACRKSCQRASDCVAGDVCAPANNEGADRVDFVCRTPTAGLLPGGSTCTTGNQCASGSCITSGGSGVCFAPCVMAADCPAAAPMCVDIFWNRPNGGTQPGRACVVR